MMDDKTKRIIFDLTVLLDGLKRAMSSPSIDKKKYRSKISSEIVQLRMQKDVVPEQKCIADFIKQCERASLTLGMSDIDRAILLGQQLNKSSENPEKSKSSLETVCKKYNIEFIQSSEDESEQEAINVKIKEKYKI